MTIKVKSGGALQTASAISVKIAGVLRSVRTIRVMIAGTLQTVYSSSAALTATAVPVGAAGLTTGTTCTTNSVTVTPTGGTSPFTYAWTLISSSGGNTPTIASPTLATTTFSQVKAGSVDESNSATFRCTVTDSIGATATDDVEATFEFSSTS